MSDRSLTRSVFTLALAVAAAVASSSVSAQQSPALDRVSLWLGGYYSSNDTTVTAQGTGSYAGIQGTLNFEDDLGLKQHSVDPRVRLDFLLGDSQGFSFDYYQIHRDLTDTYEQPIPALGIDAGANLKSTVDYNFGSASYKWWFGHASDVFGVGLGAAYYKVDFRVAGNAYAGGQATTFSDSYTQSAWAPMLTLGWRHAFDEHWRMYADVAGVKKNGGDLSGHIWNAALGVEWFPWQNMGFALEYSASRLHLDKDFDDATAKLDLNSDGPAFYLRARF
ncbi:MAG: hypothetical protein JSS21_11125 [Proteobacteria bacterium]|nr:hypothetical protein [Pseudomonadota bacterium]